ncbi:MAG: TolC family protein [Candidatus Coatesbacteria bacterium]|nr:TolC family protein [Candidatus Coatesbacteria bacterium]
MTGVRFGRVFAVGILLLYSCLNTYSEAHGQDDALTLKTSIETALANHAAISQAQASLLAAQSQLKSATTGFLPTASVNGYYTRLDHDRYQKMTIDMGAGEETMEVPSMRKYQYSVGLQVVQPLFTGGAIYYSRKQARGGVGVAEEQLEGTKQDVALGVAHAYYAVLQAEQLLGVAKLTAESMAAHRKTAKEFFDAGVVAKVDLLQAEVRLAEAEQGVIRAKNTLDTAEAAFNNALGRDISTEVQLAEAHLQMPLNMSLSDCLETAVEERPELIAMRKSIDVAASSEKLARSAFFPQFSGVYEKNLTKERLNWDRDEDWSISLVASWDVWEWGRQKFDLDYARAKTDETRYQTNLLEDNVLLEVKQAYLSVDEAQKLISVTKRAIEQAEENVRMSNERYAQSIVTITEVLDAEVLLANARLNYYASLYDYDLALARLLRAMGKRIEDELAIQSSVGEASGD